MELPLVSDEDPRREKKEFDVAAAEEELTARAIGEWIYFCWSKLLKSDGVFGWNREEEEVSI